MEPRLTRRHPPTKKASKDSCENLKVQSSSSTEGDMNSSSTVAKEVTRTGSRDPGVVHRLTFRADPDLLEPREKQRKKLSRNEIEKLRRDRLNAYFMELAKIVPLVIQTDKKIDKASILRLTVAYLRIYHDLVKGSRRSRLSCNWRPDITMYENLGNLLLESFGGFLLVISRRGILIFATEAITKHLGHNLSDVLGSEVRNIIHPNDYGILLKQFEATANDTMVKDTDDDTDLAHVPVNGQRSFCLKMLNVLNPQSTCYEIMHLVGHLKKMTPVNGCNFATSSSVSGAQSVPEPSVCLVAVARLVSRQPIQELLPDINSIPNQWITRHELDGKITYSDQRGALLTGFLPGESIGFSPYSLLHPDDIASIVAVHNMFLTAGCVPQTVFRMFTKSREILYVQTNTHLVVDMWTSKPKFIISINTVLEEHDGIVALEQQRLHVQLAQDRKSRALAAGEEAVGHEDECSSANLSEENPQSVSESSMMSVSSDGSCFVCPEVEVEGSSVIVIVGENKHLINLSEVGTLDAKKAVQDSSISIAFDSYATEDDGGQCIPTVKPSFMNGSPMFVDQPSLKTDVPKSSTTENSNSCQKVARKVETEKCCNGGTGSKTKDGRSALSADALLRRFSDGDGDSLIELSGFTKMYNGANGSNCQTPKNLLLRQLLTRRLGSTGDDPKFPSVAEGAEMTLGGGSSSGSFVGIMRPNDGPTPNRCPEIKSLLRTEMISTAGSKQDSGARKQRNSYSGHTSAEDVAYSNVWNSFRSPPNNVSTSPPSNGHVVVTGKAKLDSLLGFQISRGILPSDPRRITIASNPTALDLGVKCAPLAARDKQSHIRKVRNGEYSDLDSRHAGALQNGGMTVPQTVASAALQNRCTSDFSRLNGHQLSRLSNGPLLSQVLRDGGYPELRNQLIGQQTGEICSDDDFRNGSGAEWSQRRALNFPESGVPVKADMEIGSVAEEENASSPSETVFDEWPRSSEVVVFESESNACSNVENNGSLSTFSDFDDTLAFAQPNNGDFSNWNCFIDDL